ncbi:DUF262 domain-containing protein [Schleiferilactobacillus harbinensis]|uniref:DUF262 domain-containing protein n=1 Tax=Schleiferilactobacillus harbinensis TaxID=304207 RepID=UPI0007B89300|nr:DUF262 domain-containing protein [Schleiferilactobacillus harbinensis]GEK05897.1 hypothetical protein LHA01_11360 [Schleiferilactobacillus harbinensis]
MTLFDEYEKSVKEIKTDAYAISIGEVANLYKDGDLVISPEYQRYFRWGLKNKSDFVESVLLGIPIPSLFVSQDVNGRWDVIDGLQRISTVLEFMGILKRPGQSEELYPELTLEATKFLPSLEGKKWDGSGNIGDGLRRIFKRRKLSFIIVDENSNSKIKYELFQRLNTNGLVLKPQEVRNVSVLMVSRDLFTLINRLNSDENYQQIYAISANKKDEQADKDAVSAFVVMETLGEQTIDQSADIGEFITDRLVEVAPQLTQKDLSEIESKFVHATALLADQFGTDTFKKWIPEKNAYKGPSLRSIFEVIFPLVANNLSFFTDHKGKLIEIQKSIPSRPEYLDATRRGTRATNRFSKLLQLSRKIADESQNN